MTQSWHMQDVTSANAVPVMLCLSCCAIARVVALQAYGVWWFPPMVLNCAAFLLSLAWGLLIFTLSWLRWQSGTNGTQVRSPMLHFYPAVRALAARQCLKSALYALSFIVHILPAPVANCLLDG